MSEPPTPKSDLGERFPGLALLAQSYVNYSLDYLYGDPESAVEAFLRHFPGEESKSAVDGITALLTELPNEEARLAALLELRWGHAPRAGMLDEFLIWTRATLIEGIS